MNINKFTESIVRIDEIEELGCFGHYPFQLHIERPDGKFEMAALALNGINEVQKAVEKLLVKGFKKAFLSLDYPPMAEIKTDFVAVFTFENDTTSLIAIPYSVETGERLPVIEKSDILDKLKQEMIDHLKY